MLALYVFLGGGIGSLMRYGISQLVGKVNPADFPLATFVSNLLASLILGVGIALLRHKTQSSEQLYAFLVIGICGGFSTFSTFAKENLELFEKGHLFLGILNILVSLVLCIAAVYFGKRIA